MRGYARMAAAAGLPCTPHSANLSLVTVFTLHLMGAIENAGPYVEFSIEPTSYYPWQVGIYEPVLTVEDGIRDGGIGMTIATLIITCVIFVALGWTGDVYAPIAISVGAIVCICAANAGNTSQDLKTGYIVGATPIYQQMGLAIGVVTSSFEDAVHSLTAAVHLLTNRAGGTPPSAYPRKAA